MSHARTVDATNRARIERPDSPHALLAFVTVSHASLGTPIRVVSDVLPYVLDGHLWQPVPFGFELPTDEDSEPRAQIVMQNVDRRLGAALRQIDSRAMLDLQLYSSADFDLTQEPRVALGLPVMIYGYSHFELVDVTVTATDVTGTVIIREVMQEPWPQQRATQGRLPGLFR